GLDIDFTSEDKIKGGSSPDAPSLCPAPLVYILNSAGCLVVYSVVDLTSSRREVSCPSMTKAEVLPGLSGSAKTTPKPSASTMKVEAVKKSAPPAVKSPAPAPNTFKMPSAPVGGWNCETCMIHNKDEATQCAACETKRVGAVAAPKPSLFDAKPAATTSAIASGFKMPSAPVGGWTCDICMIHNKDDATQCAACETKRVGASAVPKPSLFDSKPAASGGFKMPSAPVGGWDCEVCMIHNTDDVTQCAACETKRVGAVAAPKPSLFEVKAPAAIPSGGFTFGGALGGTGSGSATPASTSMTGGFSFGAAAKESSSPAPLKSAFGTTSAFGVTSAFGTKAPVTGGFSFTPAKDSPTPPPAGTTVFGVTAPVSGGFSVTPKKDDPPPADTTAFGVKPPVTGGFSFTPKKIDETAPTIAGTGTGGFSFVTKTDSPAPSASASGFGGFTFAAKKEDAPNVPATNTGGFSFKPDTAAAPVLGAPAPAALQGGFTFATKKDDSSTKEPATGTGGFSFIASKDTPATVTGFGFGGSTSATGGFSFSQPKVSIPAGGFSFKPAEAAPSVTKAANSGLQWTCDVCLVKNDDSKTQCLSCETKRPADAVASAPVPFPGSLAGSTSAAVPVKEEKKSAEIPKRDPSPVKAATPAVTAKKESAPWPEVCNLENQICFY
ncbi:hypothetical protein HDU99_003457, partial [Rhizoclosmatium hyalinum]